MAIQFILGIDGGGTKTIARIQNQITNEKHEDTGGSSSITNDFEGACYTLMTLIDSLLNKANCQASEVCLVMGLAGAGNQSQVNKLKQRLALPFASVEIYNDARTCLIGANEGKPVAMVALGTGSVGARIEPDSQEHYVGGWGFPHGDEGGGAKLGFTAIQVLLNELDKYGHAHSELARWLLCQIGPDKDDILNWLRESKPAQYAILAKPIFEMAKQCSASVQVVKRHALDVEALIQLARGNTATQVVLMGGLAEATFPYLSDPVKEYCVIQKGSSLEGACYLATKTLNAIILGEVAKAEIENINQDKTNNETAELLLTQLNSMVSEERNPESMEIDLMDSTQILQTMNKQDQLVPIAIQACIPDIALAVDKIEAAFKLGGRLIYVGAGTSGRLGVLDAVECPPTFSVDSSQVVGIIAGGNQAIYKAVEGAEDDLELAKRDLQEIDFNAKDVLVGIAASGRTPYVIGALHYASSLKAQTVSLTCNPDSIIASHADISICPVVGPEILTGSTRLKSGTAQKLVLNMLTTAAMIRTGKSYQNLMVDVNASNEKLYARAIRIVMQATKCERQTAEDALQKTSYKAKPAILQILTGVDAKQAESILKENDGFLRKSVNSLNH